MIRAELKNSSHPVPELFDITRSLPHGHVAAVLGTLKNLGLDRLIDSKPSRQRQLCLAMIVARIIAPRSKLATSRGFCEDIASDTLGECLGVTEADWNDLYAAMDWLLERQSKIENKLARRHLQNGSLVMYDLTSTWVCVEKCELAQFSYSRDKKRGVKTNAAQELPRLWQSLERFAGSTDVLNHSERAFVGSQSPSMAV